MPPGTEVLAVNGVLAVDGLAKLVTVGRADGGNVAKRVASLEVRGTGRYESFDIFLPLSYPATGERPGIEPDVSEAASPADIARGVDSELLADRTASA